MVEEADSDLLEFYGTECVHCRQMEPLIERLEAETNSKVKRLEVWHNESNASLLREIDKGFCGGVPFFFNKRTGKWLCGAHDYEALKQWALGNETGPSTTVTEPGKPSIDGGSYS